MTVQTPLVAVGFHWSTEELAMVRRIAAPAATPEEFEWFVYVCNRTGLDPLLRQIHLQKREDKKTGEYKATIQTGIDGYRLIADRTGQYAGNDDPTFDSENAPTRATVTVWKMVAGVRCPFEASARWSQYCPGGNGAFMWNRMPHLMLGKCAEALALRKAFPQQLAGIYSDEEMEQADYRGDAGGTTDAQRLAQEPQRPSTLAGPTPLAAEQRLEVAKETVDGLAGEQVRTGALPAAAADTNAAKQPTTAAGTILAPTRPELYAIGNRKGVKVVEVLEAELKKWISKFTPADMIRAKEYLESLPDPQPAEAK